jgi:hypothetical protein
VSFENFDEPTDLVLRMGFQRTSTLDLTFHVQQIYVTILRQICNGDQAMKLSCRSALTLATASALWLTSTSLAQAYLDPATGSFFLQMVIGGIAGGLVVLKMYWAKVKGFLTGQHPTRHTED